MKKIQIEMNRHYHVNDREDELQDVNDYWDEQLAYYDNINVQLQNLVELYAISLLAEEKHYDVPSEKLEQAVKTFRDDVKDIKKANEYIEHYGEARFNQNIYDYTRQSMLRDRVVADLEKQIKEEQPFIRKEELNYFLSKQFEELSIDQMNDLVIEVHVK